MNDNNKAQRVKPSAEIEEIIARVRIEMGEKIDKKR